MNTSHTQLLLICYIIIYCLYLKHSVAKPNFAILKIQTQIVSQENKDRKNYLAK